MIFQLKKTALIIFFMLPILSVFAVQDRAQTPKNVFDQYIADLQENPSDTALREKIIKLALTLDPSPAVPEEAERFMARGIAAIKGAKEPSDFADAVGEFQKAALAAPWLANVYNNLGIAQDKAGQYAEAINSLKLYLLAAPEATDVKDIKALIYEIEYRQEKAEKDSETKAKESSPEAVAARERQKEEDFIRKLDGSTYSVISEMYYGDNSGRIAMRDKCTLKVDGEVLIYGEEPLYRAGGVEQGSQIGVWKEMHRIPIISRRFTAKSIIGTPFLITISDDGRTIAFEYSPGNVLVFRGDN